MTPAQLQPILAHWRLSQPVLLAQTATSHVFRVQQALGHDVSCRPAVLKLLTDVGVHDEAGGAVALRHYNGNASAHLYAAGDRVHLLEWVDGPGLTSIAQQDDDTATRLFASVLSRLHMGGASAVSAVDAADASSGLWSLERRFRSLLSLHQTHPPDNRGDTDMLAMLHDGATVARYLLAHPLDRVVLHGDLHHDNILHSSQRGWLAIDAKGVLGERTCDAASALCNPASMPQLVQQPARLHHLVDVLAAALDVTPARLRAFGFAHACLSLCWSIGDDTDTGNALWVARQLWRSAMQIMPRR